MLLATLSAAVNVGLGLGESAAQTEGGNNAIGVQVFPVTFVDEVEQVDFQQRLIIHRQFVIGVFNGVGVVGILALLGFSWSISVIRPRISTSISELVPPL